MTLLSVLHTDTHQGNFGKKCSLKNLPKVVEAIDKKTTATTMACFGRILLVLRQEKVQRGKTN